MFVLILTDIEEIYEPCSIELTETDIAIDGITAY